MGIHTGFSVGKEWVKELKPNSNGNPVTYTRAWNWPVIRKKSNNVSS